jgi:transketolase
MRKTCLDMVYRLAKRDPRIFFVGSDLGAGTLSQFREEMPERFLMEGISEANIIGVAAGLAMEGKVPYVHTIATFLTRRCFEQVVLDLGLHNVPVRLLGAGGGLVYAPLGPTHQAIDDLAIMRSVPNMTVIAPADADEMRRVMPLTVDHPGPIYIRIAKGFDPVVTADGPALAIGRALPMRHGRDALVVTTGITLQLALEAATALEADGIEIAVVHVPTVKPLDRSALLAAMAPVPIVITVEEHTLIGGLGSAVAEIVAEERFEPPKHFKRIGIPDVFPDGYGSQASLMARYGITAAAVAHAVRAATRRSETARGTRP